MTDPSVLHRELLTPHEVIRFFRISRSTLYHRIEPTRHFPLSHLLPRYLSYLYSFVLAATEKHIIIVLVQIVRRLAETAFTFLGRSRLNRHVRVFNPDKEIRNDAY